MSSSVISHYEIVEKIGEGGHGTVYMARDLHVPRMVALKVIFPDFVESKQAATRFQEEARAICSLNHPNIVVLHDFDADAGSGCVFLVLEYLSGGTLRQHISQAAHAGRPLDALEICRCSGAIAAGLGHAHRRGITHRDMKSSNVMFSDERVVKVTDFGLAKTAADGDRTDAGRVAGTPCYMSPEQAQGLKLDHRTDIFSLGIVMYEMAAGQIPFQGSSSFDVLRKIVSEDIPPLNRERPDLPPEFDRIIRRATAKRPDERYQRVEELGAELAALEDKLKRVSEMPTQTVALPPPARRTRRKWEIGLAVAAVVLIALFAMLPSGPRRQAAPVAASPRMLAVIPFDCLGQEESRQAFCEGLAHTVSMKLTNMESLQDQVLVVPYADIRREGIHTAGAANKLFKAQLALTGSVVFAGDAVRIIVNLVDAGRNVQTASEKLDAPVRNLIRLQDDTSSLAGRLLEMQVTAAARSRIDEGQTSDEAAYAAFLGGLGYLTRSTEVEDARRAARLFEEAIVIDPSYALAHAYLAEAYLSQYRKTEDGQWLDRARESCERALQIDDRLASSHVTAARVWLARTDPERAIRELKAALALEPRNAEALRTLGNAYLELGMRKGDGRLKQQALEAFNQSIALRPELWTNYRDLGLAYIRLGDLPKAEEQYGRMLTFTGSADAYRFAGALYYLMDRQDEAIALFKKSIAVRATPEAYSNLGTAYYYQKRYADVIPAFENALQLSAEMRSRNHTIWGNLAMAYMRTPGLQAKGREAFNEAIRIAQARLHGSPKDADAHASLSYYLVRTGDGAGALRHARLAMELAPDRGSILFRCALVYERLNRRDEAIRTLARAIQKGHPMREVLNAGDLEALRADPRFRNYLDSARPD